MTRPNAEGLTRRMTPSLAAHTGSASIDSSPAEVSDLSCWFGSKCALEHINLRVPAGGVFGLVGENGAGKTTLIRHLLGLCRPAAGRVRLFGLDPARDPVAVFKRVGYLSEYRDLPPWMTIDELLRYTRAFYPTWDPDYADQLRRQLDLDPRAQIKTLSQGQHAKAGLLVALAFRPELLVLDEPSTGLDPVVRRDLLEVIIRAVGEAGRTVFFSSHLLDEVERVSDRVAILHQGKLLATGTLGELRETHSRWRVRGPSSAAGLPQVPGLLHQRAGPAGEWELVCHGAHSELKLHFSQAGLQVIETTTLPLNELFLLRIGGGDPAVKL